MCPHHKQILGSFALGCENPTLRKNFINLINIFIITAHYSGTAIIKFVTGRHHMNYSPVKLDILILNIHGVPKNVPRVNWNNSRNYKSV